MSATDTDEDVLAPPTEADYLTAIGDAHERLKAAEKDLRDAVWAARHARPKPVTWEKIASVIGITRQGATERFTPRYRNR